MDFFGIGCKPRTLAIFLFLITCSVIGQEINFDAGNIQQKKYYEEITFEEVYNKIIIPVQINGKTYRFLLDTGAPNLISKEISESLYIQKSDSVQVKDANNLIQHMNTANVPNIQIGGLNFENQVALVLDIKNHKLLNCFQIDGIIGSNLLRNSILKVSQKEQKIVITDQIKSLNLKTKGAKIKLIGSQKAPYIQFFLKGKNKAIDFVLIDTGMDGYYEMSNRSFNIFQKNHIFDVISMAKGVSGIGLFGAGEPMEQKLFKAKTANLAGKSFENLIINTTSDENSRIGLDFFNHGDVIIDFKHKKAYFEGKINVELNEMVPKFQPSMVDDQLVIGLVWDQDLVQKMNSGDKIISIDGLKIEEIEFCNLLDLKNHLKNKKQYIIEIKNKEEQIITLEIKNP